MSGSSAHFEFQTTGFLDSAEERAERANEHIGSMALARWLADALRARGIETSEPWNEDHGCDFSITEGGKTYLCVCATDEEEQPSAAAPRRAAVTVDQTRGLMDRLFGRNSASNNNAIAATVADVLGHHAEITHLVRLN